MTLASQMACSHNGDRQFVCLKSATLGLFGALVSFHFDLYYCPPLWQTVRPTIGLWLPLQAAVFCGLLIIRPTSCFKVDFEWFLMKFLINFVVAISYFSIQRHRSFGLNASDPNFIAACVSLFFACSNHRYAVTFFWTALRNGNHYRSSFEAAPFQ